MATSNTPAFAAGSVPADAFHILQDCRRRYLKQLGQLLQEAGPVSLRAVEAFQKRVGEYYDEMSSPKRRSGFEEANGLTASRISLVGEHDLELDIRLTDFTARLNETTGGDLWRVYLRFVTLLDRPDLSTADNPVGPKGIALGLSELCAALGESHDQTLQRIDQLEHYFASQLSVLYADLNTFLADERISAAQPALGNAAEPTASGGKTTANPAAQLQRALSGAHTPAAAAPPGAAGNLLSQATLERLLARLDELDKAPPAKPAPAFAPTATSPSLESLIPGLFSDEQGRPATPRPLDADRLGIPDTAPEAPTIDTLGRIFEAVFTSDDLPDAVKSILASLQIPMLKAAMLDPTFFSEPGHALRRAFDLTARAALGLPLDTSPRHPLCLDLQAIVARIRNDYGREADALVQPLADLKALIGERENTVSRCAETYLPLLFQADRKRQAHQRSQTVIEPLIARGGVPAPIVDFLRQTWRPILIAAWLEGGEQGRVWQESVDVIGDLLWSVQPKTELDDRKRLAKILPPMLQRLNAGMARLGVPQATQAAFLDTCFALQTAAMRRTLDTTDPAQPPALPPASTGKPVQSEVQSGTLTLKVVDVDRDLGEAGGPVRSPIPIDSWVRLTLSRSAPLVGRLSQISPESGLLLFANPDWPFALALHPDLLRRMLKGGSARRCDGLSLFDVAAEQALNAATTG